jgi:hypothetical protein
MASRLAFETFSRPSGHLHLKPISSWFPEEREEHLLFAHRDVSRMACFLGDGTGVKV